MKKIRTKLCEVGTWTPAGSMPAIATIGKSAQQALPAALLRAGESAAQRLTRMSLLTALTILAAWLLTGCETASVSGERKLAHPAGAGSVIIYVADFDLGAEDIQHEEGVLSARPGPVGRVGERLSVTSEPPQARAHKLVDLMSNSLVEDFAKAGFTARRLMPGAPLPARGWLVRGVFTEVQEGNRVRRAMIGFGTGQTDLQVVTDVVDLSEGAPHPLFKLSTEAGSGQGPGAAPTLVLGPYGAAARFVMSGKDLEKNVRQTAAQIAARVTERVGETQ